MQTRKPLISIIVPHLNQPEELEHCLRSLESQTLDRDLFEVVVVDNGSSTLPEAVVSRYPRTRLSQELKPGPGLARNRGVSETAGDILAFIDADCRANPIGLRKLSARSIRCRRTPSLAVTSEFGGMMDKRSRQLRHTKACLHTALNCTLSSMDFAEPEIWSCADLISITLGHFEESRLRRI